MPQEMIQCPHCGRSIELSRAITHDLEVRLRSQYDSELAKAREKFAAETATREAALHEKLAAVRQEKLLLQEKEKNMELELQRRLDEKKRQMEERAIQDAEERQRLKFAEKDHQMEALRRQIDDLRRQADQGSQQRQGEVLEIELETLLRREFPFDTVDAVAKGVRGGDILQEVRTQSGRECGKILWETKRTKNWSPSWIQKLKDDQRDARAAIAVLVSESLPDGFHHFRQIDGVWVTDIPSALSLALALRVILIQVARTRESEIGRQEKMETLYHYLTGPEFKNRVEAILETFHQLQGELEAEKRAMQRIWEKRAKQIERVIANTAGLYGELEGVSGLTLPSVKMLDLEAGEESVAP